MAAMTVADFRDDIFNVINRAVKNEPVFIHSDSGDAVVVNADDYRGLTETAYLCSIPGMRERLIDGLNLPIADCVSENEVRW